jgi:serine-type D-Ala-D-Ala carboxypeptidase (penicillin-binding protein 5/6)
VIARRNDFRVLRFVLRDARRHHSRQNFPLIGDGVNSHRSLFLACILSLLSVWAIAADSGHKPPLAPTGTPIVPPPPQIAAKAWILMDAHSGRVLLEHDADQRMAPASLTKMMTGYVLSQAVADGKVKWQDKAQITPNSWAQNPLFAGSSLMWVDIHSEVSLKDLYYGLVISSGNDASVAIAEHLAGSEEAFAGVMNEQAKRLGLKNTHFVNSHGLPDPQHYTTARDLALLSQAMVRDHPADYAVYAEQYFTYNNIRQMNRNELLGEPGVDGIKTGHTEDAGFCLVSSAQQDGMRLIGVVLGTHSRAARTEESRKMLGYGFRFFETRKVLDAGKEIARSRVWGGAADDIALGVTDDVYLTLERGRLEKLQATSQADRIIEAPVATGAEFGSVSILEGEQEVLKVPLKAIEAVDKGGFFHRLWDAVVLFFLKLFGRV